MTENLGYRFAGRFAIFVVTPCLAVFVLAQGLSRRPRRQY